MKSLFKVSLLAATVILAVGCQKDDPATVKASEQAQPVVETVTFHSEDDKAAYAIGVSFANYLTASIDKPSEIGVELNKDIVLKGIEHVFAGNAQMTEEETRSALESLDKRVASLMQAKAAEKAETNKKAGDEFRTEFAKQDGVKQTQSGLLYQVVTPAEGESPKDTDTVQVHYKGTLIDGTQFDSSYDRGEPATFPLNRVIPGWTEGVQLMQVGAKYKFVIPPELAYGEQDTPTIPANSTLVFEVELLKIGNGEEAK
ncbi:FKBP-type peptidyl-prolyl cis-trans isomerase [Vibrio sp. V27_P1S3P104]|uniref:FKBP-type peptidyl-prolyl cis-trans isomerase n=1 Tax=unclassified Vibrio TaxID=2614977 RepID=UPI0013733A14|nr:MULTISPECIES: FKBP-type peptidyl-prolyl cis-trans isomerase [unclassified Vibrio]NAW69638.1 FKBP-type peptidyl-prolyl cis-trans isomerase [Vibrio sp. V28_P6S34P95]NAX06170.1 FKBP-type peptidyl-prolyl cis-trans isomerase [Vibrio sp. V30_P3S12P165]NAX33095.1 FKBP-type peptidyl-prolyl cis-trans isomerase [Vibrio sp. V29_P1S30P107]NAX39044.1 FKBP-type peptidyl-prolyl cis-trans isomerase [Vibrio sp. V27_P1S3P104]NAX39922.1 FKBP-type peptidyl-prolyl cis-trans isomerase [Vibrio sp. V26_P1S5P106]